MSIRPNVIISWKGRNNDEMRRGPNPDTKMVRQWPIGIWRQQNM